MNWVIDTAVFIDHLRGKKECSDWLARETDRGASLMSLTVVRTELLAGMRPSEAKATYALFSAVDWLDVNIAIADRAGLLARKYLRSHPGIDTVDYLLAAATLDSQASLATKNLKHFPMFKGLRCPY
jgi:predicted nucleic acid-binding protein